MNGCKSGYTINSFCKDISAMDISMPITVWLDSNSIDSNSSFLIKLSASEYVETFTEVHPCIAYINSHPEQPIFFIVSGFFAPQIVPQIYESSNVLMIFVFCASMKAHTEWAMDFCDKLLMFDHEDDLLQRLWSQFEEYLQEQAKQYIKQADECKEHARRLKQSCG
jgi:hypothetical protein